MTAVLEGADLEITEAIDGLSALKAVRASRPDVVVLDVMMPGMDGLAVCRTLRGDPETAETRIVLLSASTVRTSAEWREAGADAFLAKPFGALDLMDAILGTANA